MLKHLLYHTYRSQFGWLWMFWFICALQAIGGMIGVMNPWIQNFRTILFVGQSLLAGLAVAGGITTHAMVGDNLFWKTRPIARRQLLQVNVLYVLTLVYLPLLGSLLLGLLSAGFSGGQLFLAIFEWLLYSGVATAAICAAAVHSRNLVMVLTVGGVGFLCFTLIGAGYQYLISLLPDLRPAAGVPFYYRNSSLLVALGLMLGAAGFAYWWRQLRNEVAVSGGAFLLAGFVFYPIVMYAPFSFLKPNLPVAEGAKMEIITEKFQDNPDKLSEQILWSHFRATGVPAGTVLMPTALSAQFKPKDKDEPRLMHTFFERTHSSSGMDYLEHSPSSRTAFRVLQSHYPADTVWSGRWSRHQPDYLPTSSEKRPRRGAKGRFAGYLRGEIIDLRRLGDLPLANGFTRLGEGHGVSIRLITDDEGGLQFELREATPLLMFSRQPEFRHNYYQTAGLYVLYHPESREAILLNESGNSRDSASFLNNQSQSVIKFRVPRSKLRERLNGHKADDWAKGLRLHAYYHRRVAKLNWQFADDQYSYEGSFRQQVSSWESDSRSGFESLKELKWPGANDPAQAQAFAREFIKRAPTGFYSNQATETSNMLIELGPDIVPFFLNEAPYPYAMGKIVLRRVFSRLARPEHLPALRQALARDPALASLVRAKQWEKECAPVLIAQLKERERILPAEALIVIARQAGQEHFTDLAWHSTRCASGQEYLYLELRKLDGFPYEQTVRDAWALARLQFVSENALAVYAAEFGELDALHHFIRQLDSSKSASRERRAFEILRDKLDTSGNQEALRKWLLDNAARIRFDRDQGKYVI